MDFLITQINKGGKQVQQLVTGVTGNNTNNTNNNNGNSTSGLQTRSTSNPNLSSHLDSHHHHDTNNSSSNTPTSASSVSSNNGGHTPSSSLSHRASMVLMSPASIFGTNNNNNTHSGANSSSNSNNNSSNMNHSSNQRLSMSYSSLPLSSQQSNNNSNSNNSTSSTISPRNTIVKSNSLENVHHHNAIPVDMENLSSATVANPWNSNKFLTPYVSETKITGYTIEHYPTHFLEPFNSYSARKQSSEEIPMDLINLEQQMGHYETMIHNHGAHNFSPNLLSSLISFFGNSPSIKVQEQLIGIFRQVVPVKSSDLNLEYWSVMNIVYKNADSYSLDALLSFCNLSQYFDPTIPLSATVVSNSSDLSSSVVSASYNNNSGVVESDMTTNKSEVIPIYDSDVLNLSFGVCLRMCERYAQDQVSHLWILMLKILYRNCDLLKLNQHWDSVILLFNNSIAKIDQENKIEFGSFVKSLVPHHTEYLTQQVKMNHEKTPNSSSAVYIELPSNLYLELCLVLSQVKGHLVSYGVEHIEKNILPNCEQLKKELNAELILGLPRTLSLVVGQLLVAVRSLSQENHSSGSEGDDSSLNDNTSQLLSLYQLVRRIEKLLGGDAKHLEFLIETIDNTKYIIEMKQKLVALYEELALEGTSDMRAHSIQMLRSHGESLKARLLSNMFQEAK